MQAGSLSVAITCALAIAQASPACAEKSATAAPNANPIVAASSAGVLPAIGNVIVHGRLGGRIFGFDIDQYGNEGLLSEAVENDDGSVHAMVETFDQRTGAIVDVIAESSVQDDFLTLGIVDDHVGLVDFEHEAGFLDLEHSFPLIDPLTSGHFHSKWTPPIDQDHLVMAVSRNQGVSANAFYAYDNSANFHPQVFLSNVARNTSGPLVVLTDASFGTGAIPALAYNDRTKNALLGIQTIGNPFIAPTFALVDLSSRATTVFTGVGQGGVNGIAIDSATNIACTTTELDFSVQFYDLHTLEGTSQALPGATNQLFSGADVAVDSQHGLFLVAQPISSTAAGSSIYVYDETGRLIEELDGFNFSNASDVVPLHIALHPSLRIGFVDGPDPGVSEIQGFAY